MPFGTVSGVGRGIGVLDGVDISSKLIGDLPPSGLTAMRGYRHAGLLPCGFTAKWVYRHAG